MLYRMKMKINKANENTLLNLIGEEKTSKQANKQTNKRCLKVGSFGL